MFLTNSPALGLVLAAAVLVGARPVAQDWERANREIVRLEPSAFEALVPAIRPHNVVRGRFTSAEHLDIAVLCSTAHTSSILVYPSGALVGVRELARQPDRHYLQVVTVDGVIGFSRSLGVATPQYIRRRHQRYEGPTLPAFDHDGIDDGFLEKASVVWYWHRGQWLRLQGTD